MLEIAVSWIEAITPLYANAAGTLTPTGIGMLFAYAGVIGVIFQLPGDARRRSGSAVSPPCCGAAPSRRSPSSVCCRRRRCPCSIAAITLLAFARMLSGPLVQAIVSELAPRNAQATYQAAFSMVFDLKDAVGPAIGTWLYAISTALPWGTGVIASIVASFALAVAARRHEAGQANKGEAG